MGSKFVVSDPRKCVGCKACMTACLVKHFQPGDVPISRLNVVQADADTTAPVVCRHCEDAPCAAACPTGALYRDGNRVAVDIALCIGCRGCVMACPFGAVDVAEIFRPYAVNDVEFSTRTTPVVVKCDRCVDRPDGPACISACTSGALSLVDQRDIDANVRDKRLNAAEASQTFAARF